MLTEERHDHVDQLLPSAHHVAKQVFAVVVVSPVGDDLAHSEKLLELVQTRHALRALRHHELVSDLVADSVAASASPAGLAHETDREATFSVYKTNNPALLSQPFLLVFRTVRIFTTHDRSLG